MIGGSARRPETERRKSSERWDRNNDKVIMQDEWLQWIYNCIANKDGGWSARDSKLSRSCIDDKFIERDRHGSLICSWRKRDKCLGLVLSIYPNSSGHYGDFPGREKSPRWFAESEGIMRFIYGALWRSVLRTPSNRDALLQLSYCALRSNLGGAWIRRWASPC